MKLGAAFPGSRADTGRLDTCPAGSQPVVTVVVPVYNIAENVSHCAQSLAAQTYANLEVVFVDDGSTDDSATICGQIAANDLRFRVVSQPNGGLSAARNTGVQSARGDLLMFVDGDDVLVDRAVEMMVEALASYSADMAVGAMAKIADYASMPEPPLSAPVNLLGRDEAIVAMFYGNPFDVSACCKLAATAFWRHHPFPEGVFYEDLRSMTRIMKDVSSVAVVRGPVYGYYMRAGSITGKQVVSKKQCRDYYHALRSLEADAGGVGGPELRSALTFRKASEYVRMFRFFQYYHEDPYFREVGREIISFCRRNAWRIARFPRGSINVKIRTTLIAVVPRLYPLAYRIGARIVGKKIV